MVTPYQMCINNVARHIADHPAETEENITAFTASTILAIAWCKSKEEVINDLLLATGTILMTERLAKAKG